MEILWRDLRHGIRTFTKSPGATLIAVLTLGMGLGVNTAVFSVVNALILRPLPVRDSERLTVLATRRAGAGGLHGVSFPDLQDYRAAAGDVFEDIAGYSVGFAGLALEGDRPERVLATWVTGNYFSTLDLRPAFGRLLRKDDGDPGHTAPLAVLGHSAWRRRFGGDPSIEGRTVKVNGRPVTIIGVAPPGFAGTFAFSDSELYLPVNWAGRGNLDQREVRSLHTVARLWSGRTIGQAQAAMDVVSARLERQFPDTDKGIAVRVLPERYARPEEDNARTNALGASIMTVLVGLVLVVAAMNVTNLLLAHAVGRRRETAIRLALGAGRWGIVRQQLAESLLLATPGGIVGVLLGAWSGKLLAKIRLPGDLPVLLDFHLDWRVFVYAAILTLSAGMLAGIVPALRASRVDLDEMLRDGRHGSLAGDRHRVRGALVAAQVATCFVLLVVGGLFVRSLARAERVDLGFRADDLLNLHMDVGQLGYADTRGRAIFEEIERRVRAVPGVEDLSYAFTIPMGYVHVSQSIDLEGRPRSPLDRPFAGMNAVGPAYFATMGIPITHGRAFTERDDDHAPRVALVNERLAEECWPGRDPLGLRFSFNGNAGPWIEVVGVTRTGKYHLLFEDPQPYFYVPLAQFYTGIRVLQARTSVPPETLAPSIERIIHTVEPGLVLFDVQSMARALGGGYGLFLVRVAALFAAIFGMLALVLVAGGLYGVVSHTARERTHEIGVRVALGAAPHDVLALILRRGLIPAASGIGVGLPCAMVLSRQASGMLFGITANDPATYLGVALFLCTVALGASLLPARRALQMEPMATLRHE